MRGGLWWLVLVAFAASAVAPHDRLTWALEIPWVAAGLAWCAWKRPPMTGLLAAALAAHALVLIAGGQWTYERVPLGEWWREWFGFERNHYDRLGHLFQGFVPALMVREWLHHAGVRFPGPVLKGLVIVFAVEGFSAIFELIEWAAALVLGGGATAYLRQPGRSLGLPGGHALLPARLHPGHRPVRPLAGPPPGPGCSPADRPIIRRHASVAQSVEQGIFNPWVVGSIPTGRTIQPAA
jgi:putative membrane protein